MNEDPKFMYYLDLHFFVLKQKYLYYYGVSYGFKPIPDEDYDVIEGEYKRVCEELGREPEACQMVGFDMKSPMSHYIAALAMRDSDESKYEALKHGLFVFKKPGEVA